MPKTPQTTTVEVERHIDADPIRLYALVSDITNMGRWSPETNACRWIKGATGPVAGARFRGANRSGWRRWSTTSTVVTADPGVRFAFDVRLAGISISRWTYAFEEEGGGSRVVERWDDRRPKILKGPSKIVMGVADRASHNRAGMEATLAALKAAVETTSE